MRALWRADGSLDTTGWLRHGGDDRQARPVESSFDGRLHPRCLMHRPDRCRTALGPLSVDSPAGGGACRACRWRDRSASAEGRLKIAARQAAGETRPSHQELLRPVRSSVNPIRPRTPLADQEWLSGRFHARVTTSAGLTSHRIGRCPNLLHRRPAEGATASSVEAVPCQPRVSAALRGSGYLWNTRGA